ncbi:LysR family transcriptional regulator [Bradyrhizobium sp. WBOS7]|uniref:LysR family transcriptional regulator n=1 Tax=Bradyrhizobium betae TaxID=244734 RepID=A0AAE9N695_9BRAD|nr:MULTISPECIES: LysR family transcriptional regulator [Bradyrhizobium]MDD1574980.1 LysR family transcriptional regulator [Bradyrhizobium sp. WBOS1]UUO33379.1 LysR family transcriptional regulator [Bradyrhizobium sp. WBOS01]MDD1531682.1 LysR family transcriptional regulator [Bradyrhizobium sp. WBOS2]MDD1580930.1 LysR family transcriptional regulator [Bradyrhizobium sp. WBOS7]MDD1604882.1 LysR family transcriptional regulator [Bradyrhizobium sp. WBOS16]
MEEIEVFLAVVEAGSQTAAARRLGRSLQSVNRALAALERSVGVELVRRTTRQSVATEAGLAFYRRVKPAFAEIGEARLEAANRRIEPSGLLRIAAPIQFGATHVVPAIAEFMARFPQIEADVNMSDRPVDVVGDGFDLAVRIRELPDSSLKTRRLGELRTVVYGAPDYFKRHGRPRQPNDLADHQCILRRTTQGEADIWRFRIDGRLTTVQVNGRFRTDSTTAAHAAARHGIGVGYGPFWQIRDLVDQEALEIVLADFEAPRTPVRAVFPPSAIPPAKTHLFVDLLAERLKLERL